MKHNREARCLVLFPVFPFLLLVPEDLIHSPTRTHIVRRGDGVQAIVSQSNWTGSHRHLPWFTTAYRPLGVWQSNIRRLSVHKTFFGVPYFRTPDFIYASLPPKLYRIARSVHKHGCRRIHRATRGGHSTIRRHLREPQHRVQSLQSSTSICELPSLRFASLFQRVRTVQSSFEHHLTLTNRRRASMAGTRNTRHGDEEGSRFAQYKAVPRLLLE